VTDYTGFNRLLRERSPAMLRTAFLFTGDHYLAEDLLQAALTKTYLRWGNLREEAAGEAYVRKVMASIYTRWYRRKWNAEYPTENLPERGVLDNPYGASEDRLLAAQLLASLSRRQRAVVVLRFYEDMSERDVAEALGMSVGTVKSTTSAALGKMRTLSGGARPPGYGGPEEVGA
jgi:RNA polymerase sigma-70 factor (sigma-E family)